MCGKSARAPVNPGVDEAALRLINGQGARFPVDSVVTGLRCATPDNHGVDQQFCPNNQSPRACFQGKIAGHPGRYVHIAYYQ